MEKKNNNLPDGYETPSSFTIGWIIIGFSLIPLVVGINQSKKTALIAGIVMVLIGIALIVIGWLLGKKLIKKLKNNTK